MKFKLRSFIAMVIVLTLVVCLATAGVAQGAAVAKNYQNTVFIPSFASFQLGTECYSNNLGTRELANKKNGPASMHYPYIWQENYPVNIDRPLTALEKKDFDADMKLAPRYFRVNLTKAQKVGTSAAGNFKKAIARGDAPGFIWAQDPWPLDNTSIPPATTKIYIASFIDSYGYSKKFKNTDTVNQAKLYVNILAKKFARLQTARPKAKLYIGSMELCTASFPRIDNPKLMTDTLLAKWGGNMGGLVAAKAWNVDTAVRKEINKQLADLCTAQKYIFVDFTKSGLTDANGFMLEKYAHVNGVGFQMNQAGLTLEGDYICSVMGLPSAKVAYKLK